MNSLLLFREGRGQRVFKVSLVDLEGKLPKEVVKKGSRIRVGIFNEGRCYARIVGINGDSVEIRIDSSIQTLTRKGVGIVGLSRPQTQKKVIYIACSMGLREIVFVRGANSHKSYLDSRVLSRDLDRIIVNSLEQCWDGIPPKVLVFRDMKDLLSTWDVDKRYSGLLMAKVGSDRVILDRGVGGDFAVCVGGEAGWTASEEENFLSLGFMPVGLGDRILRVETAFLSLLAQVI